MLGGALRLSSLSPLDTRFFFFFFWHSLYMKQRWKRTCDRPTHPWVLCLSWSHLFCPLLGIFLTPAFASLCLRVQLFSLYYILNKPATPQAMSSNENWFLTQGWPMSAQKIRQCACRKMDEVSSPCTNLTRVQNHTTKQVNLCPGLDKTH